MADNIDMFSKLTNDFICMIISFLPFKEAARTSILSMRWRRIWLETNKIEFLESFFVKNDENEENKELHRREFVDFIRQWIGSYNQSIINSFCLEFSKPRYFLTDVHNCITFAVARNSKELALDFHDPMWQEDDLENHQTMLQLPMDVYRLNGVESLKLFSCNLLGSHFNKFGALKQLSLGWIELSILSIKKLLVQCPLLESLSLKRCWNIEYFEISLPNLRLKRLVLDKCNFIQLWFQIEAPNLSFFKYSGREGRFVFDHQDSLVEAELDFGLYSEFDGIGDLLYELLGQLHTVRVLTVCPHLLQVIPHGDEPLGMTIPLNVEHLILNTALHPNEYLGINFMLKSCPSLKTLTINLIRPSRIYPDCKPPIEFNPQECWTVNFVIFRCITKNLKVVHMKGFKGTMGEAAFLNYLIYFGCVMEELNLHLSDEVDENGGNKEVYLRRAQSVQRFKRPNKNLRISIY